jgi:hypothetical protein
MASSANPPEYAERKGAVPATEKKARVNPAATAELHARTCSPSRHDQYTWEVESDTYIGQEGAEVV